MGFDSFASIANIQNGGHPNGVQEKARVQVNLDTQNAATIGTCLVCLIHLEIGKTYFLLIPAACVSFNTTGYHYNYKFAALPKSADGEVRFKFSARATYDVHISLSERNQDTDGVMYEIVVGGWYDTKSAIRRGKQTEIVRWVHNSLGWLDEGTLYKDFWVSAAPGTNYTHGRESLIVSIGKGSDTDAFLSFEDHQPISVNYFGFGFYGDVKGSFTFCGLALNEP